MIKNQNTWHASPTTSFKIFCPDTSIIAGRGVGISRGWLWVIQFGLIQIRPKTLLSIIFGLGLFFPLVPLFCHCLSFLSPPCPEGESRGVRGYYAFTFAYSALPYHQKYEQWCTCKLFKVWTIIVCAYRTIQDIWMVRSCVVKYAFWNTRARWCQSPTCFAGLQ